jgi:drug/metabolite transporter (DMT)-like permease
LLSFLCAVLASVGNAVANVAQRKASLDQSPDLRFGPRMLRDLMRRPIWLLGFAGMVGSFGFQAVALSTGQLSAVETVITLEVPLTLLVASWVFRTRLGRTEWVGVLIMTAGAIDLVAALNPQVGDESHVSHTIYVLAGGGTAATITALIIFAQRGPRAWRTMCLGAATGTSFGLTATLIKETTFQLSHHGLLGVVSTWQTYAAIGFGLLGVIVMQWALHSGPLLAAQPGFTLMDPLVSILWGVLVYNEGVRTGWWLALAAAGGAAIVGGVLMLARSPLLAASATPDDSVVRVSPVPEGRAGSA